MCLEPTTNGERREHDIAHLIWVDVEDRTSSEWVSWEEALRDAKEPFQPILTVGIVIWEDDIRLSLTTSAGPEENAGVLTIPKSLIVSDIRHKIEVEGFVELLEATPRDMNEIAGRSGEEKV